MYTKKIKANWIMQDCIYRQCDFMIIKVKFKNNILSFSIGSNDIPRAISFILNHYDDNLINKDSNFELISIIGAFNENTLRTINMALDENAIYINDPYNE